MRRRLGASRCFKLSLCVGVLRRVWEVDDALKLGADEVVVSKNVEEMNRFAGQLEFVFESSEARWHASAGWSNG